MKRAVALLLFVVLIASPSFAAVKAAPTVSITSPEPGITLASDRVEVTAVYAAPQGAAIALVELVVDGVVVQTSELDPAESSGVLALTWEASGYLDGAHRVVMRVTDTKGRVAKAPISVELRRDLQEAQPIEITAPAPGAKVAGRIGITVDARDGSAVKYVIFLVDNVFKAMSNIRPFAYRWDTSAYLNGFHRLQVKAYLNDGSEALSRTIEVRVDNPSGATTLKAPPAPVAPSPAPAPSRAAVTTLPPAVHSESATPFSKTVEVSKAETGPPGTAPYVSATGELVQPPTTMLAERAGADTPLAVATVAEAAEAPALPAEAETTVAAPPVPLADPTRVAVEGDVVPAPAADSAATEPPAQAVAPMQVAALPTPDGALARTPAESPSVMAAAADLQPIESGAASVSPTAVDAPPVPKPTATAAVVEPQPVIETAAAKPAPVVTAPKQLAMVPPQLAAAPVKPAPVVAVAPKPVTVTTVAKPAPVTPAPKQIALLPSKPVAKQPAPKLSAEPAAKATSYVVKSGDCLYEIAEDLGVTPYQLAKVNGLQVPYVVHPGQTLSVPESGIYVAGERVYPFLVVTEPRTGWQGQSVAFRQVVEKFGGTVSWDPKARQAKATARGHQVVVTIGDTKASVDGKPVGMTMDAILVFDRTVVPARFLGDALDLAVTYDKGVTRIAAK